MRLAYTIIELDRHENADQIRSKVSFLEEMKIEVCDARKEYPDCTLKYPEFKHIFTSLTNVGMIGLWISDLNCFYSLLNSDYDALLIFEDDAILVDDFERKFKSYLEELPDDFGMFSIGYADVYKAHYKESHFLGKNYICRMFQSGDSYGILYRKEFVKELLDRIVSHKILGGFPDTAIMSFALGNVGYNPQYKPYSILPSIGGLVKHNTNPEYSSIAKSPNTADYIK